jgi:hypothetical protein
MSVSLRITTLAAAALLAASLTGGTAALASVTAPHRITPDTITGTETGQGATLQKAVHQASAQMNDDYNGCVQPFKPCGRRPVRQRNLVGHPDRGLPGI